MCAAGIAAVLRAGVVIARTIIRRRCITSRITSTVTAGIIAVITTTGIIITAGIATNYEPLSLMKRALTKLAPVLPSWVTISEAFAFAQTKQQK